MKFFILLNLLIISPVFAVNPYELRSGQDPVCDDSYVELKNLPPVRAQGLHGLCYAFSALNLLEYLRCSGAAYPQGCYSQKGSSLHLSRFNNTYLNQIKIGGDAGQILAVFQNERKLARESCTNYESWSKLNKTYEEQLKKLGKTDAESDERDAFYFLTSQLNSNKDETTLSCLAKDILQSGMQSNIQDVVNVLKQSDNDWRALRYKLLVPQTCFQNMLSYPEYSIHVYPSRKQTRNSQDAKNHVYQSLKAGVPIEANFCAQIQANGKCGGHSLIVVGQRNICNTQKCTLQFRVQNSYGQRWQELNDNGWVEADNFIKHIDMHNGTLTTVLPKDKNVDSTLVSPQFLNFPMKNAIKVALSSKQEALNSDDKCWVNVDHYETKPKVAPLPNPVEKPTSTPTPPTKVDEVPVKRFYICKDNGTSIFTDTPKPGMICEEKKF